MPRLNCYCDDLMMSSLSLMERKGLSLLVGKPQSCPHLCRTRTSIEQTLFPTPIRRTHPFSLTS
ncbi:hypothetical protein YC2023_010312 [Brassica napus]